MTRLLWPVLAALSGMALWLSVSGPAFLDPSNVGWLMRGDWAQHLVGWHAFRHDAWQLPPGAMENLTWPGRTAVVYTDSLPLLAIPLKLFSPLLPDPMQFQGIWFLA